MRLRRSSTHWILSVTFIAVLFWVRPAFANALGNPSFEVPIGDSAINWDDTNGTSRITTPPAGFDAFPDGSGAIQQTGTSNFTFQLKKDVQPGDFVVFSTQAQTDIAAGSGGQLRLEFKGFDPTTGVDSILVDAVNSGLIDVTNALNGGGTYPRFTVSGTVPQGAGEVVFVIRRQGAAAGTIVYDNVNGEINPSKLTLSASKTTVKPGDVVTVVADFVNASTQTQTGVELKVELPSGLDIIEDTIRNNGGPTSTRQGSILILSNPSINANDNLRIVFQVLISSGVSLGKLYEILASVTAGGRLSEVKHLVLRVRGDPLFDEGTILGKVFDDRNEDGMQTKGEIGVRGVRLYTEYGVSVITDQNGQFHIPAVKPGRHVLKIDGHTLPEGTRFLTEESLLIKTTPGLLNKVRFAVHFPDSALPPEFRKDLQMWLTQGTDLTQPQLRVAMDPTTLKVGLGRFEREPTLKIKTNYGEFISSWRLDVIDEMGEKVWTGTGVGQPPAQVAWNGTTDSGELIQPGTYGYRLIVRDHEDHEDWTPLGFFQVVRKAEIFESGEKPLEIPTGGAFNIQKDGRRAIPLVAKPTVRVYGKTEPNRRVRVNEVPIEVGPTGEFEEEFFVKPGDKKIVVSATNPEGETVTVEDKITVKDSFFFLVALAEEELGINVLKGSVETVGRDDAYHEGFYQDGRLSYYLKAKIKGKFFVKSRYDTSDKRSEFFTHLDPDDYYPIYGDYSQIDYEGQDTRERFFLLVEMDRSYLKWGSYETNFTDTELARYNRTLSGLKVHHESINMTKYGDPKRGFTVFGAKTGYLADHNEFRGTGGSLYYLRNRNAIQGSEKIRIETRDKIQDVPLESRDLIAGKDYEIDYVQGRILLREPLSSVAGSETIISNDILNGNPVYLIVDYEFETFRQFEDGAAGFRGYTSLGNHIRVGVTAVEEKRQNIDYDLRGADLVYKAGKNTKVTAEIAQSQYQQVRQATSYNGGLSFQSQSPVGNGDPIRTAYQVKVESKPIEPLELSGYMQEAKPGFSIDSIKSQEGFRKYGLQARLKLSPAFYILARHDMTELSAQIRPLAAQNLSASLEKLRSTTLQAVFDYAHWKVTGEYLNQAIDVPSINQRIDSIYSEMPFRNAVGLKIARSISDWITPYARAQYAFAGEDNFQVGGGLEAKVLKHTKIFFEEMIGEPGDSTVIGINHQQDEKTTSYATVKSQDRPFGERQVSTSFGSSHQLSDHSRFYSERQYSTYTGNIPLSLAPTFDENGAPTPGLWSSDVYGYETQFQDRWDLGFRFERRHLDPSDYRNLGDEAIRDFARTNTFNTLALSLGYNDSKKLKLSTSVEARLEPDAPKVRQWLTQNSLEWRINQDLSFLGRTNFGTSRFLDPNNLTGQFMELNMGFAYRPVDNDRFNALTKYTFLDEVTSDAQYVSSDSGSVATDETAHIFSIEGAYEINRYLQTVEKFAYRLGSFKTALTDSIDISTLLFVHRFNYHITRKWDIGIEYRMLFQGQAGDNFRHGPLVEIDREIYDYVRLGVGYNFTGFEDDLRKVSNFKKNSFFVRLSGKV